MSIPLRVLIVEDSEDDTLLLVRELRHGGYDPTYQRVETPEAMRAALEAQTWDIVISDHTMPHFSGPAALALLQASGLDLPFILVSGTIGEETAVAAMKAGAHDYIMKGNPARLIPAVERELREAEVRREYKRAEEKIRYLNYLSAHDALTGLYNRAFFEEEMARLERGRQFPVSVVMADIDGLKAVNDNQGHAAGDELLRRAAAVLRSTFRAEDVVARIGGDEFAVLLPSTDAAAAEKALARVVNSLLAHNTAHGDPPLRLSVGTATAERGRSLTEALKQADERMYQEKHPLMRADK